MNGWDLFSQACELIPGGTQLLSKRPSMYLPQQWPSYFTKARGVEVTDLDGRTYIDMSMMGIGVIGCGNISAIYLRNLKAFESVRVAACADLDIDRARARAAEFDVPRALTVDEILVDPQIEVRPATNQVDNLLSEIKIVIKQGHRVLATTLTKKLAEDLTAFYLSSGLKVKYLHSDRST